MSTLDRVDRVVVRRGRTLRFDLDAAIDDAIVLVALALALAFALSR